MAMPENVEADLKADVKLSHDAEAAQSPQLQAFPNRRMIRGMTPEQGRAIETIGHAVDYLKDCYLTEGPDEEVLDFRGPEIDAVGILITAQRQILRSLPLTEPLTLRLWHVLLRRKSHYDSAAVVPLSSSR